MTIRGSGVRRDPEPWTQYDWQVEGVFGEALARPSHESEDLLPVVIDVLKHCPELLQWRPAGESLWQVTGAEAPVVQARILTPQQVVELGERNRKRGGEEPQRPCEPPAPESFSKDYFTSAIMAGAVPSWWDLESGIRALLVLMLGLIETPRPELGLGTHADAAHFERHCERLADVLRDAAVEYRRAVEAAEDGGTSVANASDGGRPQ